MSSGRPSLPMGCAAVLSRRTAAGSGAWWRTAAVSSVSTNEGQIAFTRMFFMAVIDGHALRQQNNCTFGSRIGGAVASADNPERGSHVYDRTAASLPHMWQRCAREQPDRTNIHVEGVIPLFFGNLLGVSDMQDSRVVYENV